MQYVLLVFIIAIGVLYFYRAIKPIAAPSFKLMGAFNSERFSFAVADLANKSKAYKMGGAGLSTALIKRYIFKAYKIIARKNILGQDCFEFERWLYDNFYKLNSLIASLKKQRKTSHSLPHVNDYPRIFTLMQLIVKANEGYVSSEILAQAISVYNLSAPLTYAEVSSTRLMLNFALAEYFAIFAARCIKINAMISKGFADGASKKVCAEKLNFNSYIYGYMLSANKENKRNINDMCQNLGAQIDARMDTFYLNLSRYNACLAAAFNSSANAQQYLTDKLVLTFSPCYEQLNNIEEFSKSDQPTKFLYLFYIAFKAKKIRISQQACLSAILQNFKQEECLAKLVFPQKRTAKIMTVLVASYIAIAAILSLVFALIIKDYLWLFLPLSIAIFIALSVIIINSIIKSAFLRRCLPAYSLDNINRELSHTLITVPRLIASEGEIDDVFSNISTIIAANADSVFSYNLLLDFPSSCSEIADYDEGFLAAIKQRYSQLDCANRVSVIVRARKKTDQQDKFQGWEKKRGAIIELNKKILNIDHSDFMLQLGEIGNCKYVITLDSDSQINTASHLVEIMEHPYNFDKAVVSINMSTAPQEANATNFSRLFAGGRGLDSYSNYNAELEYDVFGCGNYTGKGIYRVKQFNDKTGEAFLENRLLSHDYIEGAFSGCAVSNVQAMDGFPKTYSQFLGREIRWLKGDWQLLPYLLPFTKDQSGKRVKNPISGVNKWHIFMNMLHAVLPLFSMVLIFLSFLSSMQWVVVLVAFAVPIYKSTVSLRNLFFAPMQTLKEIARQFIYVVMLPTVAVGYTMAVVVTIFRLTTKRKLLEWKVFAHNNVKVSFVPNIIAAIILTSTALVFNFSWGYYLLSMVFLSAFLFNAILGIATPKAKEIDTTAKAYITDCAQRTFEFFKNCATQQFNYLPCDNFQQYNDVGFATRTSPTNIGMYLLALVCALDFKFITEQEFLTSVENSISSVEQLPKWHGNLYNWIDVVTMQPLAPKYVSSVDNGNFLACMMVVTTAISGGLKQRVQKIIDDMDIGRLYDERRGLFRIGYNEDNYSFDNNHYDLMGSESALTYMVAVGLNKVDKKAWDNLSRALVRFGGVTLYSWTGGMFEYLMSALFIDFPQYSLLDKSCKNAVNAQIKYKNSIGLDMWGISESQYAAEDDCGNYCYRAFGVPQIAHSNILGTSTVSPYSSFLALKYAGKLAAQNLSDLSLAGALGKWGFYEAIDLSNGVVIKTYMSHHQGMAMAAAANYVLDGAVHKRMQQLSCGRAAAMLTSETGTMRAKQKIKTCKPLPENRSTVIYGNGRCNLPAVSLITNGRYFNLTAENGEGYIFFDGKVVNNYNNLTGGMRFYVQLNNKKHNLKSGGFCADEASVVFSGNNSDLSWEVRTTVLPFYDGEVSCITLNYNGQNKTDISICSSTDLALNTFGGYLSHPAYSKMFIETGYDSADDFMWAKRGGENNFYVAQFLADRGANYNSNRALMFKRTKRELPLFGRVLDPILSFSTTVSLVPHAKQQFMVYTICGYDYDKLKATVRLMRSGGYAERISGAAYALARVKLISKTTKQIAAKLLYDSCGTISIKAIEGLNVSKPIIALQVKNAAAIERLSVRLSQLKPLYNFGLEFNLAIIYKEKHSYYLQLTDLIHACVAESNILKDVRGEGVFKILNCTENDKLYKTIIENSIDIDLIAPTFLPPATQTKPPKYASAAMDLQAIKYNLGIGGITEDGGFAADITEVDTPAPYSNIIATDGFGCLVTESGGGYTFGANARESRLTGFSNDNILDIAPEYVVLSENDTVWTPTKKPINAGGSYQFYHGLGYSEFKCSYNGIIATMRVYISTSADIKLYDLTLKNSTSDKREIDAMFVAHVVLGDFVSNTAASTKAQRVNERCFKAKCAKTGIEAYVHSSRPVQTYAFCDAEFIDNGKIFKASGLSGNGGNSSVSAIEATTLPTIAVQVKCALLGGGQDRVIFALSTESEVDLTAPDLIFSQAVRYFNSFNFVEIESDIPLKYLTHFLPYQVMCSRFNGRTGFYQSSGAYGFRDQLQDCLALLYVNPKLVREHILECARHQFERGDVQHWWHYPAVGVRTNMVDDRLFLPYLTAQYMAFTRDYEIISERLPYLNSVELAKGEASVYAAATPTSYRASLLDHCIKAIDCSLSFGENGLCLMGGGDWNDAMDKIGEGGKGTSVWCSMFLYHVIDKFLPYVNDREVRNRYISAQAELVNAVDGAWEGDRFVRAYTDDGLVVGSEGSEECKIDLLVQSWAQLSKIASPERAKLALSTAFDKLVDKQNKLIKLLDPPFFDSKNIGYISGYPKGVRENGGQYTHAAVWYVMSLFESGKVNDAYELLEMINPINHTKTFNDAQNYCLEPYVIAADVYSGEQAGRGGWSWYTGSASWMYKAIVESFLGITVSGKTVRINPKLPTSIERLKFKIKTEYGYIYIEAINGRADLNWRLKIGDCVYNTDSFTITPSLKDKKILVIKA